MKLKVLLLINVLTLLLGCTSNRDQDAINICDYIIRGNEIEILEYQDNLIGYKVCSSRKKICHEIVLDEACNIALNKLLINIKDGRVEINYLDSITLLEQFIDSSYTATGYFGYEAVRFYFETRTSNEGITLKYINNFDDIGAKFSLYDRESGDTIVYMQCEAILALEDSFRTFRLEETFFNFSERTTWSRFDLINLRYQKKLCDIYEKLNHLELIDYNFKNVISEDDLEKMSNQLDL